MRAADVAPLCNVTDAGVLEISAMETNEQLKEHLKGLEGSLHLRSIRESAQKLGELLADEFFKVGVSGNIGTKQSIIEALQVESFSERSIYEFKLTMLAEGVALVTYCDHRQENKHRPAANSLRSSIWKRFGAQWKMVFHQGTPLS
jgi:glyoxylase I family protein